MSKLVKLEWGKLKQKSILGEVVIYWFILMFLPVFFIKMISADFGQDFASLFQLIESIQRGLVLFGASLISQVFIDEYKNKTITLSFGYPISRRKLFLAKALFIALFIFVTNIASFLLTGVATYLFNQVWPIIHFSITGANIVNYLSGMIAGSLSSVLISFIPLFFFAIWKRATVSTIICAIVAMNIPNLSSIFHFNYEIVITILCLIGTLSLFLSIKTAERIGEI
ncbi:bacitracin ABC transporter permease [Bacillus sp. J14TS2]|uniref:ABC transporter permease n=1 Tax=Bacillus sp. J14TS2 TaxID=2807188 RepID=UPI001B163403|nr:ABC transporter permease [Bacillus sp. J14TS2]GIN74586.1 bacitracin ABC transporter permease [Bacillus sp. J14TS2]